MKKLYQLIKQLTQKITTTISIGLMVVVLGLFAEVVLRKLANYSIPGVHEYSGYFLAILSTAGLSQALLTKAHIRIDMLYTNLSDKVKWILDCIALLSFCLIAALLVIYAYPVLEKSINNSSLANTPLATPLWIPQIIWYSGIIWFCVASMITTMHAFALIINRKYAIFYDAVGAVNDADKELEMNH